MAEKDSEKDVQVENDELKKENKDLKNQIKKLKKVKTGQGDEALEVRNENKYVLLEKTKFDFKI